MSLALFFLIILVVLVKFGKATIGSSIVAILAGFYLSSSQIAVPIKTAVESAMNSLNGVL